MKHQMPRPVIDSSTESTNFLQRFNLNQCSDFSACLDTNAVHRHSKDDIGELENPRKVVSYQKAELYDMCVRVICFLAHGHSTIKMAMKMKV